MEMERITFSFCAEKNKLLIHERGISFEEIIVAIEAGKVLAIVEHPNKVKFSHQKIYIVHVNDYVFLVPFVKAEGKIFLKTIIPSRKAKKLYLDDEER